MGRDGHRPEGGVVEVVDVLQQDAGLYEAQGALAVGQGSVIAPLQLLLRDRVATVRDAVCDACHGPGRRRDGHVDEDDFEAGRLGLHQEGEFGANLIAEHGFRGESLGMQQVVIAHHVSDLLRELARCGHCGEHLCDEVGVDEVNGTDYLPQAFKNR